MLPPPPVTVRGDFQQPPADAAAWAALPGQLHARQAARAAAAAAAAAALQVGPLDALAASWEAVFGDEAEDDRLVDFVARGAPAAVREDAAQLYELLLVHGATALRARTSAGRMRR